MQSIQQLAGALAGGGPVQAGLHRSQQELIEDGAGQELMLGVLEDGADAAGQVACRPAPDGVVATATGQSLARDHGAMGWSQQAR